MDTDETRLFYEKQVRDLALTEVLRWGFSSGNLNQDTLDVIAGNMARRFIELTEKSGRFIKVDESVSVFDNCVNIITSVLSTLGVSDLASVKAFDDSICVTIDEESCYLSRDTLGDLEGDFPQVCLYPKFLEIIITEYLSEGISLEIVDKGKNAVKKVEGVCSIVFKIAG